MKRKITTYKKINSNDGITQVDSQTFYAKASDPEQEPYMIFHSQDGKWLCDCMSFVMGNTNCKHIVAVRSHIDAI